jgi:hypothetical protein
VQGVLFRNWKYCARSGESPSLKGTDRLTHPNLGATDVSRYSLIGTGGQLMAEPAYEYAMAIKTA